MNGRILYKDICEDIINKIRSGEYKNGDSLPTQQQLCQTYGTSLITVKKAIERAEALGFVERCKGKKSIVTFGEYSSNIDYRQKILFLDVLGAGREHLHTTPAKKEFERPILKKDWSLLLKDAVAANLPPEANITHASYTKEQILNNFDNTLLSSADKTVIFSGYDEGLLQFLKGKGKKFLVYGSKLSENASIVKNNDRKVSNKAVKYLISLGHKRIAFIGSADVNGDFSDRYKGYQDAMVSSSLPLSSYLVSWCRTPRAEEGYQAMNDILYSAIMYGIPTAVFCADDLLAYGAMQAIKENQLECPGDISVIGVNNYVELCEGLDPRLSSIDKNFRLVGAKIAEFLKADRWEEETSVINCDLVIRDSVREVKKEN